jgi:uncharacterized protein (TIGR02118 family)
MVKLIVLFRDTDERRHDYDQRYNEFLMTLDRLPRLRRKAVSEVYAGPGGFAPYRAVVEAYFDSRADLHTALTSEAGVEAGRALLQFAGPDSITLFADVQEAAI